LIKDSWTEKRKKNKTKDKNLGVNCSDRFNGGKKKKKKKKKRLSPLTWTVHSVIKVEPHQMEQVVTAKQLSLTDPEAQDVCLELERL